MLNRLESDLAVHLWSISLRMVAGWSDGSVPLRASSSRCATPRVCNAGANAPDDDEITFATVEEVRFDVSEDTGKIYFHLCRHILDPT